MPSVGVQVAVTSATIGGQQFVISIPVSA